MKNLKQKAKNRRRMLNHSTFSSNIGKIKGKNVGKFKRNKYIIFRTLW